MFRSHSLTSNNMKEKLLCTAGLTLHVLKYAGAYIHTPGLLSWHLLS